MSAQPLTEKNSKKLKRAPRRVLGLINVSSTLTLTGKKKKKKDLKIKSASRDVVRVLLRGVRRFVSAMPCFSSEVSGLGFRV